MTNLILQCCREQSNEPTSRYRTPASYCTVNRSGATQRRDCLNQSQQRQQYSHSHQHQHQYQHHHHPHQQQRHQQQVLIDDPYAGRSFVDATVSRPPSPNCHCSCHDRYSSRQFKQQPSAPKSVSWSISPSPHFQNDPANTRLQSKSQILTKNPTNIRIIGRYARSSTSPFTRNFYSSQESTPILSKSPVVSSSSPSTHSPTSSSSSSSISNNYCDIHELILQESLNSSSNLKRKGKKVRLCPEPQNCRSLIILRFGSGRFPTMDLMQLDSRLIIFSLADNYTRLSPDTIFQDFIKAQAEGPKKLSVFNISEPIVNWKENIHSVPILEFGWPERHAPSLEKLCSLCKAIDSWLSLDDDRNVAVLYSKRDLSRSSLVVATFLHYVHISQGEDDLTFDLDALWDYYDQHLKVYLQPSQKRYLEYFESLLSGKRQINNRQLLLNELCVRKIPNFDGKSLCSPFVQIFQNLKLIHTTQVLNIDSNYANNHDLFVFSFNPALIIRGEILIKCYHLLTTTMNGNTDKASSSSSSPNRTEMFSLQFHTGTITDDLLIFQRDNIDNAAYDKRFRPGTTVELYFNDAKLPNVPKIGIIKNKDLENILNRNSYEYYLPDMEYTKGPLDGSLYATVSKKLNSPSNVPLLNECDEQKLDDLLAEIFQEIESFPDASKNANDNSSPIENDKEGEKSTNDKKVEEYDLSALSNLFISDNQLSIDSQHEQQTDSSQLNWLKQQKLKKHNQGRNSNEMKLITELKGTLNKRDINGNQFEEFQQTSTSPTRRKPTIPPKPKEKLSPKLDKNNQIPSIPERISSKNILKSFENDIFSMEKTTKQSYLQDKYEDKENGFKSYSPNYYQNQEHLSSTLSISDCALVDNLSNDNSRTQTPSFPVKKESLFATDFELPNGKLPMFIHDTSSFWYKPKISREDAVRLLMDKPTGTFIIRDSNSFRNAYGLALKIAPDKTGTKLHETVRHFLIESTSKGVQIKGCVEEPVFSSLAALVNQHSVTRISLPTVLKIPTEDIEEDDANSSLARLHENGAGCNVVYFGSLDVETLSGDAAFIKVMEYLFSEKKGQIPTAVINFKASNHGITLTDNSHRLFFRKHFPLESVLYCELDSENRSVIYEYDGNQIESAFFGFVARKKGTSLNENECFIFGQFEDDQPPIAIVDFIRKLRRL